jgi:hypothetical protein
VPVDVRVEHACPVTEPLEGGGQVGGQRRLADASLPARHREHACRGIEREAARARLDAASELLRQRRSLLGAHDVERERDGLDARQRQDVLAHLALEGIAQRAPGDGERNRDVDLAVLDVHLAHHVELGDRALQLRVDDAAEGFRQLLSGRVHRFTVAVS